MTEASSIESTLAAAASELRSAGKQFALVGGLAVSVRAEVRFTRDVDVAVAVDDDREAEALVLRLGSRGYRAIATVEHEIRHRLSTVRLLSPHGVKLDLLFASSGLETEVVAHASPVLLPGVGELPVGEAEELLAMKVLSMTERRLQDRIDAQRLIACNPALDLNRVRENLRLIRDRGFDRGEDLEAKLASLLE